jgi:CPA2 family monovalent cation:H+ antiporter-2
MHNFDLIFTLAGGLGAALVLGYITQRIGLSPIVGYLVAGTVVGPYTPGLVVDADVATQLAEVGVILLMFGVGLQFHIEELLAVRRVAVPGAVAQSVVATVLGALIAHALGSSWTAAFVFGVSLSVASTVVLVRVLADNRDLHTQTGHIAVGWLVVEDLFTVLALVLLPPLVGQSDEPLGTALALTGLKVVALLVFAVVIGNRVIPWILDHVAHTRSRELFTLTVLVIALGLAVGSAVLFSVSMALGAFLAGLIVGRSEYSLRAASDALPMRDAFAVLFFVSVGMLLDPASLLDQPLLVVGTLAVVMVGKPLVAILMVRLLRYPARVALAVAVALSQIGEFSFILASLGKELGILSEDASNVIVAVAIISIVLNPALYRSLGAIEGWLRRRPGLWRLLEPELTGDAGRLSSEVRATPRDPGHRAVVIGYGPTGRTVSRLLRENGIEPTIIEMNIDTVRTLREQGLSAVYGDATRPETLQAAGVVGAGHLILTSAGMGQSEEVIRAARELNPKIRVLARTSYLRDLANLRRAGADEVFSGEGEIAFALTEAILQRLRATPEQIDRERQRVHTDLFGEHAG